MFTSPNRDLDPATGCINGMLVGFVYPSIVIAIFGLTYKLFGIPGLFGLALVLAFYWAGYELALLRRSK